MQCTLGTVLTPHPNPMRVWLASFFILFAIAEVYQWAKLFTLPLPIFILGGTFLAIISNYDKYPELTKGRNISTQHQSDIVPPHQIGINIATQRRGDRHSSL